MYRGVDQFGRLDEAGRRDFVTMLRSALSGALPLRERVSERVQRYRGPVGPNGDGVDVLVDLDASASSTVVEVHAPDDVGLLARVAAVFADLELDVGLALVADRRRPRRRRVLPARRRRAKLRIATLPNALRATLLQPAHRAVTLADAQVDRSVCRVA